MDPLIQEVEVRIHGDVQNVGFRLFVSKKAEDLGIFGFVRNCSDGTVEVVAQGTKEKLKELLAYLRVGPQHAEVEKVNVEWRDVEDPHYTSFNVKYEEDE